jgi:bleomycin hydrolase
MRKVLAILLLLCYAVLSYAQQPDGGNLIPVILPCTSVKDQAYSSTCWSFAGNSFLESELIKKGITGIDISEMYTARMAWMQKINLHLQYKGNNCLTSGGQFHNIQWVLNNYGIVPEAVYNGKVNGELHHNHSELDTALTRYMAKLVAEQKSQPNANDWKYIHSLLDKHLGKLPATFIADQQSYSPQTYMKQRLGIVPDDYLEITSYTHHPFYHPFVLENKYNYSYNKYMNVPLVDFVAITDSALAKGYTVLWNGDVTDEGFNFYKGIALLYDVMDVAKERQQSFEDSTSYMDHMMHIVGYAKDKEGRKWYYIKNSWGTSNSLKGYLMMDENYFTIKTAAIVVNKNAIPASISAKLQWPKN